MQLSMNLSYFSPIEKELKLRLATAIDKTAVRSTKEVSISLLNQLNSGKTLTAKQIDLAFNITEQVKFRMLLEEMKFAS